MTKPPLDKTQEFIAIEQQLKGLIRQAGAMQYVRARARSAPSTSSSVRMGCAVLTLLRCSPHKTQAVFAYRVYIQSVQPMFFPMLAMLVG